MVIADARIEGSWIGAALRRAALCLALWLAVSPTRARADDAAADATAYAGKAAALIEPYLEAGLFAGTVLVAKDGHPVFRRAFGPANREWSVPNTLDTHFRIGSLTKAFTAAAVLQLAERGKLGLDDPISRHYPAAPAAWERVSLRMLLQHRSGIINFTALPDYLDRISRLEATPAAIVALTEHEPLLFEAGSRFEYTNTGYMLLGLAIEAASGQSYEHYLREHILGPLGLANTDYDDQSAILPRRASGYRFGNGRWRNAPPMASSVAYAAGGLRSTVDDLLAWDEALLGGKLLSAASREAMFADGGFGYGLGWFVGKAQTEGPVPRRLWSHGGHVSGFLSISDLYPDEHLAVIVLANTETAPVQKLSRELAALWFGTLDSPDEIVLEDVILDRYVGQYRLGPRSVLSVSRDGRRLRAQATGEPPFVYLPESDRTFLSPVVGTRITFDTEPDGRPTGLILHRNGSNRVGPRIDAEEAARILAAPRPEHHEVAIDRRGLGALVGRYALAPDFTVAVTLDDGRLYAQGTGQPRNELVPEGGLRFFLRSVDAQLSFETDESGRASGLVLHQNGLDTPAPRLDDAPSSAAVR